MSAALDNRKKPTFPPAAWPVLVPLPAGCSFWEVPAAWRHGTIPSHRGRQHLQPSVRLSWPRLRVQTPASTPRFRRCGTAGCIMCMVPPGVSGCHTFVPAPHAPPPRSKGQRSKVVILPTTVIATDLPTLHGSEHLTASGSKMRLLRPYGSVCGDGSKIFQLPQEAGWWARGGHGKDDGESVLKTYHFSVRPWPL